MGRKRVVHFSTWNVCVSFVPACKLDWCYNHGLFEAPHTDDESEVTCKRCLKQLAEWESMDLEFVDLPEPQPNVELLSWLGHPPKDGKTA